MRGHADFTAAAFARSATEQATAPALGLDEIDLLVRCDPSLGEASRVTRLDPEEVFPQDDGATIAWVPQPRPHDPIRELSNDALLAHVVERHHTYVRRALPYIVALLARVAGFHGKRDERLSALNDAGQELADALEAHLDEEEQRLFPSLLSVAEGGGAPREREEMVRHHREVGRLLARLRSLSGGYAAPDWSDRGHRALMEELQALDEDLAEHMRLERLVLTRRSSPPSPYVDAS
jgi:regulator of cell morphogenesis and NO signaling